MNIKENYTVVYSLWIMLICTRLIRFLYLSLLLHCLFVKINFEILLNTKKRRELKIFIFSSPALDLISIFRLSVNTTIGFPLQLMGAKF